jgi:hypothetical protein
MFFGWGLLQTLFYDHLDTTALKKVKERKRKRKDREKAK